MTLRSMQSLAEHECDQDGKADIDFCTECGDHASFCSECGLSSCCGVGSYDPDGYEGER
jgi:membrane protease subunit (stomatin/prohibitin family)